MEREIQQVLKRLRTLVYTIGAFEGSYPRILKDTPIFTRSHLIIIFEAIPLIKHLIKFSAESIPVIGKILGLAQEGTSDLQKASQNLKTINTSAESAVTEIFTALDEVGGLLKKAQESESGDDELKETLTSANTQLMSIMNALQFQDITAQKIEATNALLANLGDGLVSLVKHLGVSAEEHDISYRPGTYDEKADFDRDVAEEKQDEIDDLIEVSRKEEKPQKTRKKKAAKPVPDKVETKKQEETISTTEDEPEDIEQDDIDSLVESAQNGPPAKNAGETFDQDDIDALVDTTPGTEKPESNGTDDTVSQDDIDALLE